MSHAEAEGVVGMPTKDAMRVPAEFAQLWLPLLVAATTVTLLLALIVGASKSAWFLLGAGRGFVPEEYYHVWGFVLLLGTTIGQAVGWAGGSAVGVYVLTRIGFRSSWTTTRLAMSLVYLGLAALPISVYHLVDHWLLGISRLGIEEWITANYPDARWLLITAHGLIDWSLIPLGLVFLGVLWGSGERARRDRLLQTVLALAVLGTSMAVALSLGIHSTLVHIRL